jgi:hypothetical protein
MVLLRRLTIEDGKNGHYILKPGADLTGADLNRMIRYTAENEVSASKMSCDSGNVRQEWSQKKFPASTRIPNNKLNAPLSYSLKRGNFPESLLMRPSPTRLAAVRDNIRHFSGVAYQLPLTEALFRASPRRVRTLSPTPVNYHLNPRPGRTRREVPISAGSYLHQSP